MPLFFLLNPFFKESSCPIGAGRAFPRKLQVLQEVPLCLRMDRGQLEPQGPLTSCLAPTGLCLDHLPPFQPPRQGC